MATSPEVVVVGAGVSGLACARALSDAGVEPLVLERARGVGGRCATRRVAGQPVDFGVSFLHGSDPAFLAAVREVPATLLEGWPRVIDGSGRPCEPTAFAPGEQRLAYTEGVTAFPKHLARGLQVRSGVKVVRLELDGADLTLHLEDGARVDAPTAVLALAPEQVAELLWTVPDQSPEVRSALALLDMAPSHACLALMATYGEGAPRPVWDVSYPERSDIVQVVSHESSKRPGAGDLALVIQAHAAWSRRHLEDAEWPKALLAAAAGLHGEWIAHPASLEPHRWRYARGDLVGHLTSPLCLSLPGGARLGVTGDRFATGGGVQSAWLAGRRLAERILQEGRT